MFFKSLIINLFGKKYDNWKDFYSAKSKWINIILSSPFGRFLNISANQKTKTIFLYPSFLKPSELFKKKDKFWSDISGSWEYPIKGTYFKKMGEERLSQILSLLKKLSINFNDCIMDIGCAGGYHIRQLENKGWKNLVGIEPNQAHQFLKDRTSQIRVYNEYFGYGKHMEENPVICLFDGSIDRIPYGNNLDCIKKLDPKFIFIATSTFVENHQRDWNIELTKLGYYCSHKETWYVDEVNGSFKRIYNLKEKKLEYINSHFIFTKISEPPYTFFEETKI